MSKRTRWTQFSETIEAAATEAAREGRRREEHSRPESFARRTRVFALALLAFALLAVVRLLVWQVMGSTSRAAEPAAAPVDASRGRIVDRDGLPLATDSFVWEIYADPQAYLNSKSKPDQAKLAEYAGTMGVPANALLSAVAQEGTLAVVARGVSEEQCDTADTGKSIPSWIWCDGKRRRVYPHGALGAHVLGFADLDQRGKSGVEATYDGWLRTDGAWPFSELPGQGAPLPGPWMAYLPSPAGRDLVLHMSAPLQYLVEKHLTSALAKYDARAGSIIVLDPRTGAVLALANWPAFDPNNYADIGGGSWLNAVTSDVYEPGSVFKVITFAAGLDSGKITPDTIFTDTGQLTVVGQPITNAENRRFGVVTARQALANSINVVSARLALDLGPDTFYRYVRQFGFGKVTEADVNSESAGVVKWPGTAQWNNYDQAVNSFGQGISVTPLQMANAVAAIANGGNLMQPQVIKALVRDGKVYELPQRVLRRAVRGDTARTLTQMMVFTVESYVSGPGLVPGFRVAGKTGTAEIPGKEGYTSQLTITTFAGFLPAADPQLLILVKLVEPKASRWAEVVALPVFGQVARDAVQVLKINPDDRMP